MSSIKDTEFFLVEWNLRFKRDRLWRKKYNISFGSEEHRKSNQIDQYLDLLEERMFNQVQTEHFQRIKDLEEYQKTGKFLRERKMSQEEEDALFKRARFKNK